MMWKLICMGLLLALSACGAPAPTRSPSMSVSPQNKSPLVYVGTYTQGPKGENRAEGIYVYRMDLATGALTLQSKAGGPPNPSYLTIDPSQRYLIAVSETSQFNGQDGGGVSSYGIDPTSGALSLINSQPTHGQAPCHVIVDPSGKWVIVANYSSGNATVLPLGDDGKLGAPTDVVQHHGSSVNKSRQEGPHAHSSTFAPGSGTLLLVADLGLDRIMLYDLDLAKGKLAPHATPWIAIHPGGGPRHMAFSADARFLYVANEVDSSVTTFEYHAAKGAFTEMQTLPLLPADFSGQSTAADIHLTPSGKFLYASNRGLDSLAMFSIDPTSGKLTSIGQTPTQGKTPRNFAIDPSGAYLLAANQDGNSVVTFRIDPATGKLSASGPVANLPAPVCVKFFVK
jgi:6-phosphogluconolactonase